MSPCESPARMRVALEEHEPLRPVAVGVLGAEGSAAAGRTGAVSPGPARHHRALADIARAPAAARSTAPAARRQKCTRALCWNQGNMSVTTAICGAAGREAGQRRCLTRLPGASGVSGERDVQLDIVHRGSGGSRPAGGGWWRRGGASSPRRWISLLAHAEPRRPRGKRSASALPVTRKHLTVARELGQQRAGGGRGAVVASPAGSCRGRTRASCPGQCAIAAASVGRGIGAAAPRSRGPTPCAASVDPAAVLRPPSQSRAGPAVASPRGHR